MTRTEMLRQLLRRRGHLEQRIANYQGGNASYDKAELASLKWVIGLAEREIAASQRPKESA